MSLVTIAMGRARTTVRPPAAAWRPSAILRNSDVFGAMSGDWHAPAHLIPAHHLWQKCHKLSDQCPTSRPPYRPVREMWRKPPDHCTAQRSKTRTRWAWHSIKPYPGTPAWQASDASVRRLPHYPWQTDDPMPQGACRPPRGSGGREAPPTIRTRPICRLATMLGTVPPR